MPKSPIFVTPTQYLKNVSKSVLYSSADYTKELAPEVHDFVSTNSETFTTAFAYLKNPKATVKKAVGYIQNSKLYSSIDYGTKNLFSDLRTGKFYNRERNEEALELSGMSVDDYNSLEEFGVESDWETADTSGATSEITAGDTKIANTVEATSKANSMATTNAIMTATEVSMKNSRVNTAMLFNQNERLFGGLNNSLNSLHQSVADLGKLQAGAFENLDKNSAKYFTDSIKTQTEILTAVKKIAEIQTQFHKSAAEKEKEELENKRKKPIDWGSVTSGGMPDLQEYYKAIQKNVQDQISNLGIPAFSQDGNMLKAMMTSPLQFVTDSLVRKVMPDALKGALQEFNATASSIFGNFIGELANRSNDTGIIGKVAKILGLRVDPRSGLDTSKYEKGQVPFDGMTRKAIMDVIPSHLRAIESALTGQPGRIFDYPSGTWKNVHDIASTYNKIKENAVNSGFAETKANMRTGVETLKKGAKSEDERREIDAAMNDFARYMYDHNGRFNPKKNADDNDVRMMEYPNFYRNYDVIRQLYISSAKRRTEDGTEIIDYSKLLTSSPRVLDAKRSAESQYRMYEGQVGGAMLALAAEGKLSGTIDSSGKWKAKTDQYGNHVASYEYNAGSFLLELKDEYHNSVFNYLQNINRELSWARQEGWSNLAEIIYYNAGHFSNGIATHAAGTMSIDSINITNPKYSDNQTKANSNKDLTEEAAKNIQQGKGINMKFLMETGSDDEDDVVGQQQRAEALKKLDESISMQNQVEYLKNRNKYNDDKFKYDEDGNRIEPEDKDENDTEKEEGFLERAIKAYKKYGSTGKAVGGALANSLSSIIYTADKSIYEMMYKYDLKDEENAEKYEGFMDFLTHKTIDAFKGVKDWFKNEFADPLKQTLGITDDWEDKVKKNLKEQLFGIGKFFVDANKDVWGPVLDKAKSKTNELADKALKESGNAKLKQSLLNSGNYEEAEDGTIRKKDKNANKLTSSTLERYFKGEQNIDSTGRSGFFDLDHMSDQEVQQAYIDLGKDDVERAQRINTINNMKNQQGNKPAGWLRSQLIKGILRARRNAKNYAEGTMGRPFMGKSMLSKGELLFNEDGVSRVTKTDAYDINKPTHILNSEDSRYLLDKMGYNNLGPKTTIEDDLAKEKSKAQQLGIATHAGGTINITADGITADEFIKESKTYSAEMVAGGAIGGGVGLLFGGPLLGAAIGAGVNLIKGSNLISSKLFGEMGSDGKRKNNGLISTKIQETVKRTFPDIAKYAAAGLVPGLLTPLGPIGGMLVGGTIGYLKNNENFTNKFFGENGKLTISSKEKEILDKFMPGAIKGGVAGALGGMLLGGPFGLVGNMLVGSGLGMMASTDEFKDMLLGTEINGKREGGVVGVFKELADPLITMFDKVKSQLEKTLMEAVIDPLQRFVKPAIHALPKLLAAIPKRINKWLDKFDEKIGQRIRDKIGDVVFPLTRGLTKLASPITGLAGGIIRAPGALVGKAGDMLRAYNISQGDMVDMSASEAMEWMLENNRGHKITKEHRFVAQQTDADTMRDLASKLDLVGDTRRDMRRDLKKSNAKINNLLNGFESDGHKLSPKTKKAVLDAIKKGRTGDIANILSKYKLEGTRSSLSAAEINSFMDEGGLREAIDNAADLQNRMNKVKGMKDSDLDKHKNELNNLLRANGLGGFDLMNDRQRDKLSRMLKDEADYKDAHKDEEDKKDIDESINENTSDIRDTVSKIYEVLDKISKGETAQTKQFAKETAEATENGQITRTGQMIDEATKKLQRKGIDTDNLSDEAIDLATKKGNKISKKVASNLEKIGKSGAKDTNIFNKLEKWVLDRMTDDAAETFAGYNSVERNNFTKRINRSSQVGRVIYKGKYPIDKETVVLLSNGLTNMKPLGMRCKLLNQADAYHEFKSITEIYEAKPDKFFDIRKRYRVESGDWSGIIRDDVASEVSGAVKGAVSGTAGLIGGVAKLGLKLTGKAVSAPFKAIGAVNDAKYKIKRGYKSHSNSYYNRKALKYKQNNQDQEEEPVEQNGLGTFLLSNLAKGIGGLFDKKKEGQQQSTLDKIAGRMGLNISEDPEADDGTEDDDSLSRLNFSDTDEKGDGIDSAIVNGSLVKYRKGNDGSLEWLTSDSKTKAMLIAKQAKEKSIEKFHVLQNSMAEKINGLFPDENGDTKFNLLSLLLGGGLLLKSGLLQKYGPVVFDNFIKPLWTDHMEPHLGEMKDWAGEKLTTAKDWIVDDVLPGARDFITQTVLPKASEMIGKAIGLAVRNIPKAVATLGKVVGTALDTIVGNKNNAGEETTIDPTGRDDLVLTDENGEKISPAYAAQELASNPNAKFYNEQGELAILNEDGTLTFKDKSFAGSSFLEKVPGLMLRRGIYKNLTGGANKTIDKAITRFATSKIGKIPGLNIANKIIGKAFTLPGQIADKAADLVGGKLKKDAAKKAAAKAIQDQASSWEALAKGGFEEVAESGKGPVAKLVSNVSKILDKVFGNRKIFNKFKDVADTLGVKSSNLKKWITGMVDKIKGIVTKFIKKGAEESAEQVAESSAKVAGKLSPIGIAMLVWDFLSGVDRAESILKVLDPGPIETLVTGFLNMILGLLPILQIFVNDIAQAIIGAMGSLAGKDLKERQAKAEEYAKEYNDKHNTTYSTEEVLERNGSSIIGSAKALIGNKLKDAGKTVKNFFNKNSTKLGGTNDVAMNNNSGGFWMNYKGMGTRWGRGYTKQIDPSISNIRYNSAYDSQYQTIGDSACGPIAAVNALESFGRGGNAGASAAQYALDHGYKETNGGTRPEFFRDYFSKAGYGSETTTNRNKLADNIYNGYPTVVMGKDSNGVSANTPFGRTPHYVTVTGTDGLGHAIVQDPEVNRDDQLYDMKDLMSKVQLGVSTGMGRFGRGSAVDSGNAQQIYAYFREKGFTPEGAAGVLGNMQHESGMEPTRVQGDFSSGYAQSKAYTKQVDDGAVDRSSFANGGPGGGGYGLVQFTWHTYKEALYDNAKAAGKSIGDLGIQLDTLYSQLGGVLNEMKGATDPGAAADVMLTKYEKPADIPGTRPHRVATATEFYNMYKDKEFTYTGESSILPDGNSGSSDSSSSGSESSSSSDVSGGVIGALSKVLDESPVGKALNAFLGIGADSSSSSSDSSGSSDSSSGDNSSSGGNLNLSGPSGKRVIQAAASKLGYHEGANNDTEFGRWYGLNNQPWCAMFVSWAAHEAGIPESIIPKTAAVAQFESLLPQMGAKKVSPENASAGDIINFGGNVHTGLVEDSSNGEIHTIEGNSSDQVIRRTYPYNYSTRSISIWHPNYGDEGKADDSDDSSSGVQFAKFNSEVDDINNTLGSNPSKPMAKYGQFRAKYGMGNEAKPIKLPLKSKEGFAKVETTNFESMGKHALEKAERINKFGKGSENVSDTDMQNVIKLLKNVVTNTDQLHTLVRLLKGLKLSAKDISNAQSTKQKRQPKANPNGGSKNTGFSYFADNLKDQSTQSLVEAMMAIATE